MSYHKSLEQVLKHEGGYVDHPRDPGGATNLGITHITLADWRKKPVTKADVKALTRKEAADIYKARYWDAVRGDQLPAGVAHVMFDGAVNHGPKRMIQLAQQALGVAADGKLGPVTLSALSGPDVDATIKALCNRRRKFYRGLGTFDVFGRGWMRRIDDVERYALAL